MSELDVLQPIVTTTLPADQATRRPLRVILAGPRGFCAGVDRAIRVVEEALRRYGAPVYVRHEIVHNRTVVEALEAPRNAAREAMLAALVLEELTHADVQAMGVPLPHPQTGDKRLRALCEAVLRAPSERARLGEWAADIGASERTVARLFRDELGLSYQQWRQQAILAHALPLLARGTPVSQVAAASGYASDSAFSAMFKGAMGQPPSHFQNRAA